MKTTLLLLLCAFTVCVAEERNNGENGWYVPTGSGFIWVDAKTGDSWLEQFENWLESLFGDEANPVNFYLLTPDNPTVYQPINMTVDSIKSSNYNPKYPVKFSVHGWRQSYSSPMNRNISDAWFTRGNYNLIVPDWPRARDNLYIASVAAVYGVGQKVATFIDFLNENFNLDFNQLELVGHSLGAHVVGMAGKNVQNGVVNTIVGLDAALPLFHYNEPTRRLASTDANYVQAIHTCANLLGFLLPIGTSDFYPNGGETQPGCGVDPLGICRHARSVDYYVAAVLYDNFESMKCANYQDAVKDSCISSIQSRMGAILEKYRVDGVYYVPVNSTFPYGILPE